MSTSGAIDLPLQVFGSYCPELLPADLPPGLSPWCQDVEFVRGGVKTRPGLQSQFAALPGNNPTINYLKSYITPTEILRLLVLDSTGTITKENPLGTLTTVIGNVVPGSYGKSTTCFGREYMAFSDRLTMNGIDMPRQYDDTNFDRVSQEGPGAPPAAIDEPGPYNLFAAPVGAINTQVSATIATANQVGNICTLSFSISVGFNLLQVGDKILVAGVSVAGYNGTFTVTAGLSQSNTISYFNPTTGLGTGIGGSVQTQISTFNFAAAASFPSLPNGTSITIAGVGVGGYNGTWVVRQIYPNTPTGQTFFAVIGSFNLANSGGGTVTVNGNISAGVHEVSVMFVTRQGYITRPAPFSSWTAAGSKRAFLTGIPTGPPNVVSRILCFTASGGANFFYTGPSSPIAGGNMVIADNTTLSAFVDFTDPVLLAGTNVDENFNFVELGECSGVIDYAGRMFWWGERNKLQNFVNLSFDGGLIAPSLTPPGWTLDPNNGTQGGLVTNPAFTYWGFAYGFTGDGVTNTIGMIAQSASLDFRGVPILQQNVAYSARVRLLNFGTVPLQGSFIIDIFSPTNGQLGVFTVFAAGTPANNFVEFTGPLLAAQSSIPPDAVLRVYCTNTLTLGTNIVADNIQIYPTNQPYNLTTVRASFNPAAPTGGPEAFDGVSGLIQPQPYDGQAIRCMFKLREFLYIVKERSLYVTQDDGINEPAFWSIRQISSTVGTPSVNGVAVGEDWAVIVNRYGSYMFTGGEPTKISQEIQSNQTDVALQYFWDNVNWTFAFTLWTVVDITNRRILVGLPFGAAQTPNGIFYLDYRPMSSGDDIAASAPIHTSYSGRVINYEHARKWAPWTPSINAAAMIERGDGTAHLFLGNGVGNGLIYGLSETQLFDATDATNTAAHSTAIQDFYVPYGMPSHDEEAGLQLGSHRKDFDLLTMYVEGTGNLSVSYMKNNPASPPIALTTIGLETISQRDREQQLKINAERVFFRFGCQTVGMGFKLQKLVPSVKPSTIPVRGVV